MVLCLKRSKCEAFKLPVWIKHRVKTKSFYTPVSLFHFSKGHDSLDIPVLGQVPLQSAATRLDPFRLPLPNKLISLLTWTQNNWVIPENDIFCVGRATRYCSSWNSKLASVPLTYKDSQDILSSSRQENIFHNWRGKHFACLKEISDSRD